LTYEQSDFSRVYCIKEEGKKEYKFICYTSNGEKEVYTIENNNDSFNSIKDLITPLIREHKINNLLEK